LPDQMSFVFTFSRRRFILAMRDWDGANKNKIAVFDFGVTPKHFPHDMLLCVPKIRFCIAEATSALTAEAYHAIASAVGRYGKQ